MARLCGSGSTESIGGWAAVLRSGIRSSLPRVRVAQAGSVALGDRVAWLNDRPAGSQMASTSSSNASSSRRWAGPSVAMA